MRITLLGSKSCPNTPPMRNNLRRALALLGIVPDVEEVDQDSSAIDDQCRGYPSPTILVDGYDLEGMPAPGHSSMACRIFPDGLPQPEEIAQRIRTALHHGYHPASSEREV